jgi:ParB-like nuclease domain
MIRKCFFCRKALRSMEF